MFRVRAAVLTFVAVAACSSDPPPATSNTDAGSDVTSEAVSDVAQSDAAPTDVTSEMPGDVVSMDLPTDLAAGDAPTDSAGEAAADGGLDATSDAVVDAGLDATSDAAVDAGLDATSDAAVDVGGDAASEATVDVPCAAGQVRCGGVCVNTASDPSNCGACGTRCCAGTLCFAGACAVSCGAPRTLCGPPTMTGGCSSPGTCVDTQSDSANCGGCGVACASGQVCDAGRCVVMCTATQTRCGDVCVDTRIDSANCGACGARCCAGNVCSAGSCTVACPAGFSACPPATRPDGCMGNTCVDTWSDNNNCGRCSNVCAGGRTCVDGACLDVCVTGQTRCGGVCVDTQASDANCGGCGVACSGGLHCAAGACRLPRSCDELLAMAPSTPSGTYSIDADLDGPLAPFRVYCDMMTDGGGWTLIAASVGGTNMPRFDTTASTACEAASPTAPCFVGAAQLAALGLVEYRWSTSNAAVDTRMPLDNWRAGTPDVSARCASASEYFRVNQDIGAQGMAWTGCFVSEVYASVDACNTMYRPVWNLQRCEGVPISPGPRSSPDFNCSPFGRSLQNTSGGACEDFYNVRHWRRGRTCPRGTAYCNGACVDVARDAANCGGCGRACTGTECIGGACTSVRSCNDLLAAAPGTASGMYTIDTDGVGPNAPTRVYCDMTTRGGGWTLIASSVGGTNMPRFTEAPRPCNWSTPNAACVLGQANITAMPYTEFAWSTTPAAEDTRVPLTSFTYGASDVNATCANANEYFRCNQDIGSQGMGWTGCTPTEVYASTDTCNTMFRPVWNLLTCAGLPIAPGPRSSPDYNCSPFGANLPFGGSCAAFYDMRHWRR